MIDVGRELYDCIMERYGAECIPANVKRNELIINQGSRPTCLYLIKLGQVLLTRISVDGRETLLSVLRNGEFFGEGALINNTVASFSAHTTRYTHILQLPARKFKLLLEDPAICRLFLQYVSGKCDHAWTQMEILGSPHIKDKLQSGLEWLADTHGVEVNTGTRIDINQCQMAKMLGCSRETLNRELHLLKRKRVLDVLTVAGRYSVCLTPTFFKTSLL